MGLSNNLSCEAGSLSCCFPNPHGCFQSEVCLGCVVCFTPCHLSGLYVRECRASGCYLPLCLPRSPPLCVRPSGPICANVEPQGLLVVRLSALFVPHSASLGPAMATRVLSTPVPVSAPPTSLDECYFLFPWCWTSLPFDFLSVLVVQGGAVCLPTPPSWFSCSILLLSFWYIQGL